MVSLFEYRRVPEPGRKDTRWGYVSNMFVREDSRNRGTGSASMRTRCSSLRGPAHSAARARLSACCEAPAGGLTFCACHRVLLV
jgi:hypothetical protein